LASKELKNQAEANKRAGQMQIHKRNKELVAITKKNKITGCFPKGMTPVPGNRAGVTLLKLDRLKRWGDMNRRRRSGLHSLFYIIIERQNKSIKKNRRSQKLNNTSILFI